MMFHREENCSCIITTTIRFCHHCSAGRFHGLLTFTQKWGSTLSKVTQTFSQHTQSSCGEKAEVRSNAQKLRTTQEKRTDLYPWPNPNDIILVINGEINAVGQARQWPPVDRASGRQNKSPVTFLHFLLRNSGSPTQPVRRLFRAQI